MGSGFAKKKKEAKMFHERFHEMQEKLKSTEATGISGGGLVEITLNGDHEMTKIKIKKECIDPEDVEGLEDLIRVAYNEAAKKIAKLSDEVMPSGMPPFPVGFS